MIALLLVALLVSSSLGFKLTSSQCTDKSSRCLPDEVETALLSQRDVSYNISIDQISAIGINLKTAIFDGTGYTDLGIKAVAEVLGIGYRELFLDVYYNDRLKNWQLCPARLPSSGTRYDQVVTVDTDQGKFKCQANVTLGAIWQQVSDYIQDTDTDIAVNPLMITLILHDVIQPKDYDPKKYPIDNGAPVTLSEMLNSYIPGRIYTPVLLRGDREQGETISDSGGFNHDEGFPSLHHFLLTVKSRVIGVLKNESFTAPNYNFTSELDTFFAINNNKTGVEYFGNRKFEQYYTNETQCILASNYTYFMDNINKTVGQSWRTILDTSDARFTNESIHDYVQCGFSPIINTLADSIDELLEPVDSSLWSWASGQPKVINKTTDPDGDQDLEAYQCAQFFEDGWRVGNCYEKLYPLCRKRDMAYEWTVGEKLTNYFEAMNSCPDGSQFSVPRTALQQAAARLAIENYHHKNQSSDQGDRNETEDEGKDKDDDGNDEVLGGGVGPIGNTSNGFPVWIDMNSIATEGCWVTGGPYANCKYHRVSYDRNQVAILAVVGAVIFLLLVLTLALRADRVPVRKNQNRWKRLVNKLNQEDYEGVPA